MLEQKRTFPKLLLQGLKHTMAIRRHFRQYSVPNLISFLCLLFSAEEEEKIRNKYPIFSPEGDVDEDVTAEENRIALPHLHPNLHGPDLSSNSDAYNSALIGGASLISQQRTHNGKKRYSCSECGKCFAQKSGLGRHERNHRGNYDYTCSHCGKSFTQKAYLVVHERIHTKEKPFSCSVCGKCFNQKPNLLIHERIHSDVKPYTCSACGKCFKYKSSFTLHERLHTGDKPFSCPICSKRFSKKSSLVSHERRHIGQKPLLWHRWPLPKEACHFHMADTRLNSAKNNTSKLLMSSLIYSPYSGRKQMGVWIWEWWLKAGWEPQERSRAEEQY